MRLGESFLKLQLERCTGCNMCMYACALKHTGDTDPIGSRIRIVPLDGEKKSYAQLNCLQCAEPYCVQVCPNNAIVRNGDGIVAVNDDRCIGCLLCTLACPYGGSYLDVQANKPMVCDLCDGAPECVRLCPERAVEYDGVENIRVPLGETRDPFSKGVSLCLGCPSEIALRFASRVLGKNIILHVPPSCAALVVAGYGLTPSCELSSMMGFLTNSASIMTGVKRHYQRLGREVLVVTYTGDGGTADVGFQSLSGAAERNEDLIYICNDNEGYMNTGIQRSGTTPYGAWTSTTPVGSCPGLCWRTRCPMWPPLPWASSATLRPS
jgi:phenylglyoxylate dehydrogenase beta subunit